MEDTNHLEAKAISQIIQFESKDVDATMKVKDAYTSVSLASPLVAYLMYNCTSIVIDNCPQITTAAAMVTDKGNFLIFDKTFINGLNQKQASFLLYHEVLHIFLKHVEVGKEYFPLPIQHRIANAAEDYYINYMGKGKYRNSEEEMDETNYASFTPSTISEDNRLERFLEMPDVGLYEDKYVGLSEYQIYHILKNEIEDEHGKSLEEIQKEIDQKNQEMIDAMMETLKDGENAMDQHQQGGSASEAMKSQIEKNQMTMIEAVSNAQRNSNVGSGELGLVDRISKLMKPVVTWQDKFRNFASSNIPQYSSYNRVSRKSTKEIIFPTYRGESINLVIGIDSSGSMGRDSDLVRCYSEAMHLLTEYDSWKVWVVTCDTKVTLIDVLESDDWNGNFELNVVGGGGTEMAPMIKYAKDILYEEEEEVHGCIIMTDGHLMSGDIESEFSSELPTFIMVTDSGNKDLTVNCDAEVVHCKV